MHNKKQIILFFASLTLLLGSIFGVARAVVQYGPSSSLSPGDITSSLILDGTILNADINASAAVAWSKISKTGSSIADLTTAAISDTTGTLSVARGGTGVTTFGTTNSLLYTSAVDTLGYVTPAADGILITGSANEPSISTNIPTAVTIGSQYIYRVGGTDIAVADGGTNLSTIAAGSVLGANALNTYAAITSTSGLKLLQNNAGSLSWETVTGTGSPVLATAPTFVTSATAPLLIGGTGSGGNLTLQTTSHATKGKLLIGTSAYDEVNNRLGIATATPAYGIDVSGTDGVTGALNISRVSDDAGAGAIYLNKKRTTTPFTIVSGDSLAEFWGLGWHGGVGGSYQRAAKLTIEADGSDGANYIPGRIAFYTSNGSDNFAERMRIDNEGKVMIGRTATDTFQLQVTGATYIARMQDTAAYNASPEPLIGFSTKYTVAGAYRDLAAIGAGKENTTDANDAGYLTLKTRPNGGSFTERLRIDSNGNIVIGTGALATNATDGFLYTPTSAGTPTGTPTAYTGRTALEYDTTNDILYVNNSGWKQVNRTLGAYADKTIDTAYQATTDGFVTASVITDTGAGATLDGLSDGSNPPTTRIARCLGSGAGQYCSITFPVRKNDYYKVAGTNVSTYVLKFIPLQ